MQRSDRFNVITIDNYGRESRADHLVVTDVSTQSFAEFIANQLEERWGGRHSDDFYTTRPCDQRLWRGMEDLV